MKPHVIMHMASSIDGRISPSSWPDEATGTLTDMYEQLHRKLEADAWIVGRVTMAEFAEGTPVPVTASETFPRSTWKAAHAGSGPYAVALDAAGKLQLNRSRVNGDAVIAILTEMVSDDHLAELRRDGISYIFAGRDALDLHEALATLNSEFGIKRLLLEGGGGINGGFIDQDLVDEISLLIIPLADGTPGPSTITRAGGTARRLKLTGTDTLKGGVVHLRYEVERP